MEIVQLRSSSEDDDDVYLNSVAKLKALKKKQTSLHCDVQKEEETQENNEELKHQKNVSDADSDLEIVSVEGKPNSAENDLFIVENNMNENSHCTEDENYEINIKILWQSKDVHRLNICRNENFRKIFEYFANLEKVSIDEILITKRDKTIKKNDTPASINLSVIDILEGGIIKKDNIVHPKNIEQKNNEDICVIKIQTTNKKSLTVSVNRDENFESLIEKCAQELNVEKPKIKLYFDGELVTITDTPDSLEIEDIACFDLRLSS
ncbi:hypothetical protein WN48_00682 [Eufriesea mexicana]|uniref:Rad60/SUMO-like domain-containing protein n=1 Tax=Eufriesea mexicana TaxID=516756 RepID=A0A310SQU8_9HYME|nr:hypothetical protein WN48_00682 [Eufriesea mexicana]